VQFRAEHCQDLTVGHGPGDTGRALHDNSAHTGWHDELASTPEELQGAESLAGDGELFIAGSRAPGADSGGLEDDATLVISVGKQSQ
jgi:hypothetical protein